MGQDRISKEESGKLLDQQVHMVATDQDIRHSTLNVVQLTRDHLGMVVTLSQEMAKWPCHIDRFDLQYDKSFSGDRIFYAYIVDLIHKRVQVFLHLCNTTSLEYVDTGALVEFGELQQRVEWGEWITPPPPTWVEFTAQKTDRRRKSEIDYGLGRGDVGRGSLLHIINREEERNTNTDPRLRIMERFRDLFNPENRDGHT